MWLLDRLHLCKDVFRLRSPMSDKDRILMDPIKKWRKYNRFPFKLVIHTCVVVLVILQIFVVVGQFTEYYKGMDKTFKAYFLPKEFDNGIFTIKDTLRLLNQTVFSYYTLNSTSPEVLYPISVNGELAPVYMEIKRFFKRNSSLENRELSTELYTLNTSYPLGPFANDSGYQLNEFFFSMVSIRQFFSFEGYAISDFAAIPFIWNISLTFKDMSGMIQPAITTQKFIGQTTQEFFFSQSGWLNLFIIVFTIISTAFAIKAMFSSHNIYNRAKRKFSKIPPDRLLLYCQQLMIKPRLSWNEVPFRVKLDFFGIWHILSFLGDCTLFAGSLMGLVQDFGGGTAYSDVSRMLLGVGSVVVLSNMMKYLENRPKFAMLILSLKFSFSNNIRFLISVIPMFLGFALCGLVCFSPYAARFGDLSKTLETLFALLNGDEIHATFVVLDTSYPFPFFSQLYLYSFIVLFITAILNIFIFIIEDAYHAAKLTVLRGLDPSKLQEIMEGEESLFLMDNRDLSIYSLFQILESEELHLHKVSSSRALKRNIQYDSMENDEMLITKDEPQEPITNRQMLLERVMQKQKEYIQNLEKAMKDGHDTFLKSILQDIEQSDFVK